MSTSLPRAGRASDFPRLAETSASSTQSGSTSWPFVALAGGGWMDVNLGKPCGKQRTPWRLDVSWEEIDGKWMNMDESNVFFVDLLILCRFLKSLGPGVGIVEKESWFKSHRTESYC